MGQTFLGAHDTYAVVREIGRGAFGTVLEVEREEDRRRFALPGAPVHSPRSRA